MKFEGIVGTCELPDIFHLLSSSGRLGALVVTQGRRQKRVYFTSAGITLPFDTEQSNRLLGQILLARGIITEKHLRAALERQRAAKLPVGEILVNLGAATAEDVADALNYQLREDLFDLLTWEKATFEFEEGASPAAGGRSYARTPTFNTDAVVMEAARRADEWKRIRAAIPSSRAVPRRVEGAAGATDDESGPVTREAMSLADGTRSIDEMRRELGRSSFDVFEAVYASLAAGTMKLADGRELADLAAEALKSGDAERARLVLLHAADLAGDDLELRYDLGVLSLWAGSDKEAAEHLDAVLGRLVEEGLTDKVQEMLDSVRDQFADASWSYERRLKLLDPEKDFDAAFELAERLLEIYDRRKDAGTATKMFRHLRRFTTRTPEQATRLAGLLEQRGDSAAAAEHYYLAARQMRFSGGANEAVRLCQKALKLNAHHADAQACLRELLAEPRRRRRLRVTASVAGIVLFAGLVLAGYQASREWAAQRALDRADALTADLVARQDYDAAVKTCEVLAREFRWTTLAPVLSDRRARLEVDRRAFLAGREHVLSGLRRRADAAAAAGDFPAAIASAQRLLALSLAADDAGAARATIDSLRRERDDFDRTLSEARAHETSGRLSEAVLGYLAARRVSERLFRHDDVTLPLQIESRPSGAEVFVNGTSAGTSPVVVRRPGGAAAEIRLRLAGCNDVVATVDAASTQTGLRVALVASRAPAASFELSEVPAGPPAADGSAVAFLTRGGRLVGWDSLASRTLFDWKLDGDSGRLLGPLAAGGRFVVASIDGTLRAYDRASGKELSRSNPTGLLSGTPAVVGDDGIVVLSHVGGKVTWVDASTGRVTHAARLSATALGEPRAAGPVVGFATDGNRVVAYDPSKNAAAWTFAADARVGRTMAAGADALVALIDARELVALSTADGQVLWRYDAGPERLEGPVAAASRVFVASREGGLTAIDAASGRVLWRASLDGGTLLAPAADSETVYVATTEGRLTALRAADGTLLWRTDLPGPAAWPPTLTGSRVLVVTRTGVVTVFEK